jgi:beta-glucosidase
VSIIRCPRFTLTSYFYARQNLTLWHGGDDLILATANQCANTIVVLHTVGAVIMESWYDHPNVTAILYAGLPGQESGNSLLDVLVGTVNPYVSLLYLFVFA